ncbi:Tn3 family transposase [Streptomyces sp. NPDC021212]|uniref:Tn3 family transposase n=1 Tax=Streptomyces sp. NPDC021212 TaxID=3365118 RepID=UPI0037A6E70D
MTRVVAEPRGASMAALAFSGTALGGGGRGWWDRPRCYARVSKQQRIRVQHQTEICSCDKRINSRRCALYSWAVDHLASTGGVTPPSPGPRPRTRQAAGRPQPPRATSNYLDAVLTRMRTDGPEVRDNDAARLSPFRHRHINVLGKYSLRRPTAPARLRRLRRGPGRWRAHHPRRRGPVLRLDFERAPSPSFGGVRQCSSVLKVPPGPPGRRSIRP